MSDTFVHPMAVVEDGAELGAGVQIGPFCHVGGDVVLKDRVRLVSNLTILGATTLGEGTTVYPGAVLGAPPQNFKHKGGRTTLTLGRDCVVREAVTIHCGSDTDRGATIIGDGCYLMAYAHVAHDCTLGNNVLMANSTALGGHAEISDGVNIAAFAAIHQFARIGRSAFIAGAARVAGDVIPYGLAYGDRARLRGFNLIGLRRAGIKSSDLARMRQAYRQLFSSDGTLAENIGQVAREHADFEPVMEIVAFLSARGKRYFTLPGQGGDDDDETGDGF